MKRVNFLLVFVLAGLALQLFWEGWLWSLVVTQPDVHTPVDFSSSYTAGRTAAAVSSHSVYDIQLQLQGQQALTGYPMRMDEILPFNHPPLFIPILKAICSPNYIASYWRWVLLMLCFLAGSVILIDRTLRALEWGRGSRLLFLIAALSFYPVFTSLLKGQDTTFLLLGGMLWLYGLVKGKYGVAGLGLAMTVIRPQIAVILAVPFLFNLRRVWWWFFGGVSVLALYCLILIGFGGVQDYIHLLTISAGGQGYGMNEIGMFNFTGMMLRLFPRMNINLLHGIVWGLFLVIVVGLSLLWKLSPKIRLRHLVLAVCLSLFAAPHLHFHDLGLLLLPVLGVVLIAGKNGLALSGDKGQAQIPVRSAALLVATSLVLLFGDLWDPLRFTIPYLLMAMLPLTAWLLEKSHETG